MYDFTTMLDRTQSDAIAVQVVPVKGVEVREGFSKIPMWVADMNFVGCPSIDAALAERIKTPAYGYFITRNEYYDSIIRWQAERHGLEGLTKDMIGYENGVLGGVVSALRVFCSEGGKVLLHTPTYIGFTGSLKRNGFEIVHSPLRLDENGVWRMDFEDMEKKIKDNKIHAAVMCSPHNPCGRVWERWELEAAMEVFRRNDVFVVSDEIWSDIILNGHKHIPTLALGEDARKRTVALYAPSKTFNLAGLVGSYHVICDPYLRDRVAAQAGLTGYNACNVLSMHALIGAYKPEGARWVDELCEVLSDNVNYACDYIAERFRGVFTARAEGTYMLLLDCEGWCREHGKTIDDVQRAGTAVGVIWQDARPFNVPFGIRMNLAVPTALVREAMDRLDKYVFNAE